MTVADDLAMLYAAAAHGVTEGFYEPEEVAGAKNRVEAEIARLRGGLRRRNELIAKTIYSPPGWTGPDAWWADEARALLAEDCAAEEEKT